MADLHTLQGAGLGAFFRARDVASLGIPHRRLKYWESEGLILKFGRGLYRFPDSEIKALELESYAMLSAAIPDAVLCLMTALSIHEIGTQSPHRVWFAIDRKARKPLHPPVQSRIVRFSGNMMTYGVEHRVAQGVPIRITSPARTIVDCFRYRKKCGLDIALEALYDAIRRRVVTVGEIERAVDVIRQEGNENVIIHHCPSGYPARLDGINLNMIVTLRQMFSHPIGFSDHSPGWEMDIAALALGAKLVEKTITTDRTTPSPPSSAPRRSAACRRTPPPAARPSP